ncbi:MAG: PQQ-binding-like beta-propeller repeat protein [Limisphaerales bacterium]
MSSDCVSNQLGPICAAIILFAGSAKAAEPVAWSHPRGPQSDGILPSRELASEWPSEGPPLLWRRSLGQGYSGFIVADGRFYTLLQNSAGQHIGCFDLDSGKEIWRTRYGLPWQLDGDWPGTYATPIHADGRVYFAGCFGTIGCARASDGKLLWTVNLQERFAGKGTEFGYGCAPLIDDGRVFVPVGGKDASVVALDATTGDLIWKNGSEPASYCGSLAITVEGRRQIVSYLENITVGHDPQTGRELWRHTRGHGYAEHAAWPIWDPPYLFYSEPFREGSHVLRLDYTNDLPQVTEVWQGDVLCNDIFSSVIVDGHIYGFDILDYQAIHDGESDGLFKCIELATGVEKWAVTNTGHAMVLSDQQRLIIFNERGELILAEAQSSAYVERSRTQIFEGVQCWVAPAYYDGRLLLRAKTNMACVYVGELEANRLKKLRGLAVVELSADEQGVFDRYRSDAYFAPTFHDMNEWLWVSVLGVVLPVMGVVGLMRRRISVNLALLLGTSVAGCVACPIYTGFLERLAFTWPVAIHGIYFSVVLACMNAVGAGSRRESWIARASLLGMVVTCFTYHDLCQRYFIVMGWGFLVGILPSLPVILFLQRSLIRLTPSMTALPLMVSWLVSYVIFYWSAAWFIHTRT